MQQTEARQKWELWMRRQMGMPNSGERRRMKRERGEEVSERERQSVCVCVGLGCRDRANDSHKF